MIKFYIYPDKAGKWRWRAVAKNGRKMAVSGESFASKSNAHRAALKFMYRTWAMINVDSNTVYEAKS